MAANRTFLSEAAYSADSYETSPHWTMAVLSTNNK